MGYGAKTGQREATRTKMVDAAITNEYITRKRVDGLEAVVGDLDRVAANHSRRIEALEARVDKLEERVDEVWKLQMASLDFIDRLQQHEQAGLGARLKWLFLGR